MIDIAQFFDYSLDIAMLPDDKFIITWLTLGQNDFPNSIAISRLFNSSGNPVGDAFEADPSDPYRSDHYVSAAAGPDGNFVIVWSTLYVGSFFRIYDGEANPLSEIIKVNVDDTCCYNPDVAISGKNNFIVTWNKLYSDFILLPNQPKQAVEINGVYARAFNSIGAPLTDELIVFETIMRGHSAPGRPFINYSAVAANEDTFLITWSENINTKRHVYSRPYWIVDGELE